MIFFIKKALTPFFMPLSWILGLWAAGNILLFFSKKQRVAKVLIVISFFLFIGFGYGALNPVLERKEHTYPVLNRVNALSSIQWIVVLGGGVTSDPHLPLVSKLSDATLVRTVEGIRWYYQLEGRAKLVVSGGKVFNPISEASLMGELAESLGVPQKQIFLEEESRDTNDQATIIKKMIGKESFLLITSAYHMERAMKLFQKQGMNPIPVPVGHLVKRGSFHPDTFFPKGRKLVLGEKWVRETLGMLWAKIRGQV